MKRTLVALTLIAVFQLVVAQPMRIMADFTTDTLMVHDPVMAFEDGVFHVFATGNGLMHATSADRRAWTVHREPVLAAIPSWTYDSVPGFRAHVWAPDVIKYKGRWWLAYSCSTFGKNTSAIGLASSPSLSAAAWKDEGTLACSRGGRDDWNAIDPNFIIDGGGEPWLVFGSFWDGIQLVKLDSTMHVAQAGGQRTVARRNDSGENPIEAPFMYRHGGYYYLFVSWDYCCRGKESTYKVAVGRGESVEGPFLDREGRDMLHGGGTVVLEGDKTDYEAAGHCAVYRFGNDDIFVCHGYSARHGGASILVQKRIEWSDDGWPVLQPAF